MKYEAIPALSRDEIESAILRDDPKELSYVVLSAALHSDDAVFAEDVCARLSDHKHFSVRGNAILGFGHIARIHKKLAQSTVRPLIEVALSDRNEYVRGQANAAADDVEFFLKWKLSRQD